MVHRISAAVLIVSAVAAFRLVLPGRIDVYMIGDSTMADKPLSDNPERGWGQMFQMFFDDSVVVRNYAHNGRSTKSFIDDGEWNNVLEQLHPGSYIFIQFGHNDEKRNDSTRHTDPNTSYRQNLVRFVNESRSKGAVPVLLTPVNRREFDRNDRIIETHREYSDVVREVAKKEDVALIDLDSLSESLFNRIGPDSSRNIFLWVAKGKYDRIPDGKEDNTHFQQDGAVIVGQLAADELRKTDLSLKSHLLSDDSVASIIRNGRNKVVGLDCFHNNEWKTGKYGKPERYHYIWEDDENSGYSELGNVITHLDAQVSELDSAVTDKDLSRFGIFIIVDPDTPAETKSPHYIEPDETKALVEWVKAGGVLVLFANDRGNCEFTHLNSLAGEFGIRFNEDSRNDVVGQDYDMGKFDNLPPRPLFAGVGKIYLKEISTLSVVPPAEPVLTDSGQVIMACSSLGKGFVFAVGDPWLYNEYIDNTKLPAGFENLKAARNLFSWLLGKARASKLY